MSYFIAITNIIIGICLLTIPILFSWPISTLIYIIIIIYLFNNPQKLKQINSTPILPPPDNRKYDINGKGSIHDWTDQQIQDYLDQANKQYAKFKEFEAKNGNMGNYGYYSRGDDNNSNNRGDNNSKNSKQ